MTLIEAVDVHRGFPPAPLFACSVPSTFHITVTLVLRALQEGRVVSAAAHAPLHHAHVQGVRTEAAVVCAPLLKTIAHVLGGVSE